MPYNYWLSYSLLDDLMCDDAGVVINSGQARTVRVTGKFHREAVFEMSGLQAPNGLGSSRTVDEKD
jgi:hypothetical protein